MEVKPEYVLELVVEPTEQLPMLENTDATELTETARLILQDAVPKVIGYDPLNSADMLEPDNRFFLIDEIAAEERRQKAREESGVPKHALDWIEIFLNEVQPMKETQ